MFKFIIDIYRPKRWVATAEAFGIFLERFSQALRESNISFIPEKNKKGDKIGKNKKG